MSFKVLIVSSMVGMLLPLLKFKISSSRKGQNIPFGVWLQNQNRDKYYFDFCFEIESRISQAEGGVRECVECV